ncbi:MAG: hydroxyacylglutathione hydrolase [Frankiaceae bacterium]|jgi:glyoxylase-like metal-dependent hydrolase (beta-lactamase superfamily II)|nr:hydroxyacylglutathione hydrolase [Frankiaceae bacterium]MDQ1649118.1 hydroxyacylglutathione hydrolase [Frankiaceae bacterium]
MEPAPQEHPATPGRLRRRPARRTWVGNLGLVLVARVVASAFDTNCFVVAPAEGEDCVVVDPGIGVENGVDELLRRHRLNPVAVLLTHGHIDHCFSVTPVCGAKNIPALIHPDDRAQLTDPWSGFGAPAGSPMFGRLTFSEPDDVRELRDGETLQLAGLDFLVRATPGHTRGSVTFGAPDPTGPEAPRLFSGDLLFRGSIGRSDLPGGSFPQLMDSLARTVLPLPDETIVHCGHYDDTTVGTERATNPFLAELTGGFTGGPGAPSGRGL